MSVANEKVPPVPQLVAPMVDLKRSLEVESLRFSNTWAQWFQQVKIKIDTINANIVEIGNLSGTGFISRDSAGAWNQRTISGTANQIDVSNGDGTAGNPVLSISETYVGQESIITLGMIQTGIWKATVIENQYLDAAPKMTVVSTSATGGTATALPTQPVGYVEVVVDGAVKKMPYYDV